MDNPRPEKVAVVDEVRAALRRAKPPFSPSTGASRSRISPACAGRCASGGEYKIYKNTLVRLAAKGPACELEPLLVGPTGIAFVDGDAAAWPRPCGTTPAPTRCS